jgi:surface-anchored protein
MVAIDGRSDSGRQYGFSGVRRILAAIATGVLLFGCSDSPTEVGDRQTITDNAHLDILSVELVGSALELGIKHAEHQTNLVPEITTVRVRSSSRSLIGSNPSFAFLGAPGSDVWHLDAGWSVHGAPAGVLVGDTLILRLIGVEGPGASGVWRFDGSSTAQADFASTRPYPQELAVSRNAHVHRNWSFTAPGVYTLRFEATAVLVSTGQLITSGIRSYRVEVEN